MSSLLQRNQERVCLALEVDWLAKSYLCLKSTPSDWETNWGGRPPSLVPRKKHSFGLRETNCFVLYLKSQLICIWSFLSKVLLYLKRAVLLYLVNEAREGVRLSQSSCIWKEHPEALLILLRRTTPACLKLDIKFKFKSSYLRALKSSCDSNLFYLRRSLCLAAKAKRLKVKGEYSLVPIFEWEFRILLKSTGPQGSTGPQAFVNEASSAKNT